MIYELKMFMPFLFRVVSWSGDRKARSRLFSLPESIKFFISVFVSVCRWLLLRLADIWRGWKRPVQPNSEQRKFQCWYDDRMGQR